MTLLCSYSQFVLWWLPGGFLPFSGFLMLPPWCLCLAPGCILWLLPGALLCENTLSFGCIGSFGFLVVCRPFSGRNPGNTLVHTGLCCILPCVGVAIVFVVVTSPVGISISALGSIAVIPPESPFFRFLTVARFYVPHRCCLPVEQVVLASVRCMCT